MLLKGVLLSQRLCFPPCQGGLSLWSASKTAVGFAARPWLPPCPPQAWQLVPVPQFTLRSAAAGPAAAGFNPEPHVLLQFPGHLNFNCICRYFPGGVRSACLLQIAVASWLPASPWSSFDAGREDFRAAEVPWLLSYHPHVAAHEQPALCPATLQGRMPPPTLQAAWSEETSLMLLVPNPLPSPAGPWGPICLGQGLCPWGTPCVRSRLPAKLGETRMTCGKTVQRGQKKPCPPHCPGTPNLVMRKSQLLFKINRAPALRAEREAEKA